MATSERVAADIPAGTGLSGHYKELSGVVLGKHRLFAGGSRNLPMTSYGAESWVRIMFELICQRLRLNWREVLGETAF